MPEAYGLKVNIVAGDRELEEWGTQCLARRRKVSAYVESKTDQKFYVSVKPHLPWTEQLCGDNVTPVRRSDRPVPKSSSSRSRTIRTPDYALVASLYLDGRKRPAKNSIIYLDPNNPEANEDCQVVIKSRWIKTADGAFKEHQWAFKERPVEAVLDKLNLNEHDTIVENDEDALTRALGAVGTLDIELENLKTSSMVGQIVVELSRVTLGKIYEDDRNRAHCDYGGIEDMNWTNFDNQIIHTAGLVSNDAVSRHLSRVVDVQPYIDGEGPFATFQFFYRTNKQLAKFGFSGFPAPCTSILKSRRLASTIADLRPLSFNTQGQPVAECQKKALPSFEDNISKKSFASDSASQFSFSSGSYEQSKTFLDQQSHQAKTDNPIIRKRPVTHNDENTRKVEAGNTGTSLNKRVQSISSHELKHGTPKENEDTDGANGTSDIQLPESFQYKKMAARESHSENQGKTAPLELPTSKFFRDCHTPGDEDGESAGGDSRVELSGVNFDANLDDPEPREYPSNPEEEEGAQQYIRNQLQAVTLGKRNRENVGDGKDEERSPKSVTPSKAMGLGQQQAEETETSNKGGDHMTEENRKVGEGVDDAAKE